jgi:hypothetical protein
MTMFDTPAFDPESPDAEILGAYERIRAARAYGYSFDDKPVEQHPEAELAAIDAKMIEDEDQVRGNFATTVPGVVARLLLHVPTGDQTRWVDRALAEHGPLSLIGHVEKLDGNEQQVVHAIDELLHLDWSRAYGDYGASAIAFDWLCRAKSKVEEECIRLRKLGAEPSQSLKQLEALIEEGEERFSNNRQIMAMIMTLAPSHEALRDKVWIAINEGFTAEAGPWIARDVAALAGKNADVRPGESA